MTQEPAATDRRAPAWRLHGSDSLYLRDAAGQAVEWYPWGPEPFELARKTHRPVLLDIGAAWCHWCHVMDEGTYSDPEVVRLLRQFFITVKVDRDQHPEVDRRYQRQVAALTGEGGWPLTAFVTPGGEAFLGGTYFPPQDGMGRPGFRRILKEVARIWKDEPGKVQENTEVLRQAFERARTPPRTEAPARGAFVGSIRASMLASYDPVHAGFGAAPKFPHPTAVSFLLWDSFATREPGSAAKAIETLRRMAEGGMYDQVGGGFHRYSVDEGWHVPHFEKMGVDNAALLFAYAEGLQWSEEPLFRETLEGCWTWLSSTLAHPEGGFGSSQDADNAPGDDGSYFTWTRRELRQALEDTEFRLVTRRFGVGSEGRMPHDPDQNVLFRLMSVPEAAEGLGLSDADAEARLRSAVQTLRELRRRRPAPKVDTARYANINGGFIRGLTRMGQVLDRDEPVQAAQRAADIFLKDAFDPERGVAHRLDHHQGQGFGLLDDQVEFALGLLELSALTAREDYVDAAQSLLRLVHAEYRDDSGLLRDVAPRLYDGPQVGSMESPTYPVEDNPHLSANAAAILAFERLAGLTQQPIWTDAAEATLRPLTARLSDSGVFGAGAALAAGIFDTPPARVVVEGSGTEATALLRAARRTWYPNLATFAGLPPPPFSLPAELGTVGGGGRGPARALVCFGTRCLAPVTNAEELSARIRAGGVAPEPSEESPGPSRP